MTNGARSVLDVAGRAERPVWRGTVRPGTEREFPAGDCGAAMALTALCYAPFALTRLPRHVDPEVGLSVAGLSLICTALAFVLFFALIAEVGPSRSTVITYCNPAVAIILGVVVLGEPFTAGLAFGFPLILVGSVIATGRRAVPA